MNEEEMYKELKRNKKIIGNIDTNFFFEFAETVLNLLEKKDNEIERYKMMLAETHAKFFNSDLKTKRKNDEDLEMLNEGWKMELKKKEKTIKNMAKKLNQAYFEEDKFCQWFEKEVMQVQEKPDYGYVVDLIKQYFERKVEK